MDDGQQFYEELKEPSSEFDIESKLKDILDVPEINVLHENNNSRELIIRKISEFFMNLFNTEKQKVARQFEEQYALLVEYCNDIQQGKVDLTFDQDILQEKEKYQNLLRNGFTQIQQNILKEHNMESKQQLQSMVMLELQRMQKYCSELEGMIEEANQRASSCHTENLALQAISDSQNKEIQQLRDNLLQLDMKLTTERESNKQFMLSTVAKYKHKINSYKIKIKETQQNHELHTEEFHKYQLQENEEKNGYQKQIQQIEFQITQVVQHYEGIITNMKVKNKVINTSQDSRQQNKYQKYELIQQYKIPNFGLIFEQDEMETVGNEFQQDVKFRELQEKQRIIEIKEIMREQYEKEINELKNHIERITVNIESNVNKIEDYEVRQKNFEIEIERLKKEKKDMDITLQERNNNWNNQEHYNKGYFKEQQLIKMEQNSEEARKTVNYINPELVKINEQLIQKNNNLATKINEISLINTQLLKLIEERKRTIDGLQNIIKEKERQEEKGKIRDLESQTVLFQLNQENEDLKLTNESNQGIINKIIKNAKGQLMKVRTDLAEAKNNLAISQQQLTEKIIILKDWFISCINAIQQYCNSQNDKNQLKLKQLLKNITDLERESAEKEEIIVRLREIQNKAIETQDQCKELRIQLSCLTQKINQRKVWQEEDEKVKLLKEKNQSIKENQRLLEQNGVLNAEIAKLNIQTERLAEENHKFTYQLKAKKEKTKLKSIKDTQNIAEIHQIIQQSVQTLQNSRSHTIKNLKENTNTNNNYHRNPQFNNDIHSHISPVYSSCSSPRHFTNSLDALHINNVQPLDILNNNFTPSNGLTASQFNSNNIPQTSSKASTSVQNSYFREQSIESSKNQNKVTVDDNLSIKNDHQRIINNLSKLQKLDRFLQRSRSNSNILFQSKDHNLQLQQLNQPFQQHQHSNPTTIQITSSFEPLRERMDGMCINNNSQQHSEQSQQPSPKQLRKSQSCQVVASKKS